VVVQSLRFGPTMVFIDLSHTISDGLETYPGLPAPAIRSHLTFEESEASFTDGSHFSIAEITMVANTGTYIDTPGHRFPGGDDLADLELEQVADLPGTVIDASEIDARAVPVSLLPAHDIGGHAVLVRTDWSRLFGTREYTLDAPYLSTELCEALIEHGVEIVGIDSLNIDRTDTGERPVHTNLLAAEVLPVEHLTNLAQIDPARPFRFFAVPPRVRGMGTFPIRAFAIQ